MVTVLQFSTFITPPTSCLTEIDLFRMCTVQAWINKDCVVLSYLPRCQYTSFLLLHDVLQELHLQIDVKVKGTFEVKHVRVLLLVLVLKQIFLSMNIWHNLIKRRVNSTALQGHELYFNSRHILILCHFVALSDAFFILLALSWENGVK